MRGDIRLSFTHTTTRQTAHSKGGKEKKHGHSTAAHIFQPHQLVRKLFYLSFVALLCAQPRSRSVKLLRHHTQKLSLVFCSVAVRRADVHHLEKGRETERYTVERGTERNGVRKS